MNYHLMDCMDGVDIMDTAYHQSDLSDLTDLVF